MHTVLPSPSAQSGVPYLRKEVEVRDSGSQHHHLCRHHGLQLIQSHVAPSHGPPARIFHPFSSRQSLSCFLSHVAKGSTPKPHGPVTKAAWSPPSMAARPGFKSQHPSSSAAPFPTSPTISYTCQHSLFFQLYWAAIVSLGRCGPMAWSQSSPSSHTGPVTRGSCFPVLSWVEVTPIPLAQSRAPAI